MTNKQMSGHIGKNNAINMIDIWAVIYLCTIYILSFTIGKGNAVSFCILLILAIPFVYKIENIIAITFILSPIAYFYTQSDEGILSIYTICLILLLFKFFRRGKLYLKSNILSSVLLIIIAFISYLTSPYICEQGFFELLYIIVISLAYSTLVLINWDQFFIILTHLARLTLIMFTCVLLFSPVAEGFGRYTIDASVNVNTTGFALSQVTIIIIVNALINRYKSLTMDWGFSFIGVLLLLYSGSRNAILATIGAIVCIVLIYGKRERRFGRSLIAIVSLTLIFLLALNVVLNGETIIDASRFSIASIIESGGTSRIQIWVMIIPFVIGGFFWLGYGPSTGVSTVVLEKLVNRAYSHTHNTFVEVFAETGILGLLVFLYLTFKSVKRMIVVTRTDSKAYILLASLLGILFASVGESYFNAIVWWIIIGLTFSYRTQPINQDINL